ncbi:unnamed protein product [Callosobruchus maculatus]|uniref:Uncharacterized protein n=1 Tax=Callosobruchus maculatus TaxID=64391 RepID=A0A653BKS7_CALMS|nr:unnamed protein product [Callosobruchus maculatus]
MYTCDSAYLIEYPVDVIRNPGTLNVTVSVGFDPGKLVDIFTSNFSPWSTFIL